MKTQLHFTEHWIPSEEGKGNCCIYLTENITSCSKLLVVLQNHVGSQVRKLSLATSFLSNPKFP